VGFDQQSHDHRLALTDVGEDRPTSDSVAVFDWRTGRVEVLAATDAYEVTIEPAGWDYRVLAPVLAGGIAVVGDPALYACAGDARIADVAVVDQEVVVTVLGAGERVRLVGWAQAKVSIRTWSPATGSVDMEPTYEPESGAWELAVAVGDAGWIQVHIRSRT
jgi:hypothetical protein